MLDNKKQKYFDFNNYYDLHVIIRGVNKQNLGVYKSFISLRPKAEVK